MGRLRQTATGLATLLLAACGPRIQPAQPSTQPPSGPSPARAEDPTVDGFVKGLGAGVSEDEAYRAARLELSKALLGDARWTQVMPVAIHDRKRDLYASNTHDGSTRVAIGLTRGRAAAVLGEFEYASPTVTGPDAWRDVLYEALSTHAALVACQRRELMFEVRCEPHQTAEIDRQLSEIAADISIAPALLGGVPLDKQGRLLRRARMRVQWHESPMANAPIRVTVPSQSSVRVVTDDAGEFDLALALGAQWPGTVQVSVDTEALLGPLAESVPPVSVEANARPFDPKRWALVLEQDTDEGAFAEALRTKLEAQLGPGVPLSKRDAAALRAANAAERAHVLVALADRLEGRLDVVIFAAASARFASRAGGSRVWFEASGEAVALETWDAGQIARVDDDRTASGVGDGRASASALDALANAIADALGRSLLSPRTATGAPP